jgi:hypothetical protein
MSQINLDLAQIHPDVSHISREMSRIQLDALQRRGKMSRICLDASRIYLDVSRSSPALSRSHALQDLSPELLTPGRQFGEVRLDLADEILPERPGSPGAGSSDQLGHALRGRAAGLALALKLPDRSFPIKAGGLLEQPQAALSKPQGQCHALLKGEAEHLVLKLVSEVVGYGLHTASIRMSA